MNRIQLGRTGPRVGALGLGCMAMSDFHGPADRAESVATLHAAMETGMTLLDTGNFYGMGDNEMLLNQALRGRSRDSAVVSVKCGALRDPSGAFIGVDARPASLKTYATYSLRRLGLDTIDIYRSARLDPQVPIEETVGAIADLVQAGYVRHTGLSEVGAATIRRAAAVHPIGDVQIEYSLISHEIEAAILLACRESGIGITAYGVLARGLISGNWAPEAVKAGDFRVASPRFQPGNIEQNLALVEALRAVAAAKHVSVAQVAIARVAAQGADILPLVGARRWYRLTEALGATNLTLSDADLASIAHAIPKTAAAGDRYPAVQLARLDSEA